MRALTPRKAVGLQQCQHLHLAAGEQRRPGHAPDAIERAVLAARVGVAGEALPAGPEGVCDLGHLVLGDVDGQRGLEPQEGGEEALRLRR